MGEQVKKKKNHQPSGAENMHLMVQVIFRGGGIHL